MYVLRAGEKMQINYEEIIKGVTMKNNISLLPGDTIVMP
jgi:hypothetical protein